MAGSTCPLPCPPLPGAVLFLAPGAAWPGPAHSPWTRRAAARPGAGGGAASRRLRRGAVGPSARLPEALRRSPRGHRAPWDPRRLPGRGHSGGRAGMPPFLAVPASCSAPVAGRSQAGEAARRHRADGQPCPRLQARRPLSTPKASAVYTSLRQTRLGNDIPIRAL